MVVLSLGANCCEGAQARVDAVLHELEPLVLFQLSISPLLVHSLHKCLALRDKLGICSILVLIRHKHVRLSDFLVERGILLLRS